MKRREFLTAVAAGAVLAGCASTAAPAPEAAAPTPAAAPPAPPMPSPKIGAWGFDISGMNTSIKAGDDFFRYSGGVWMDRETMPGDRTRWGTFDKLAAEAEANVRAIIEETAAKSGAPGSVEQKIGDYYATYLDQDAITAQGLAPAKPHLDAIAAARSHDDIARIMARPDVPVNSPISLFISLDSKNPDRYVTWVSHSGLGLPEREFYLKDDQESKDTRTAYTAHIAKMLELAGQKDGPSAAQRILALETEIAKLHWPIAKRRERELTYNARSIDQLKAEAPAFPWALVLDTMGIPNIKDVVVREADAIPPLGRLFKATPVATWRDYLTFHYLRANAALLPRPFDAEQFAFFGKTLNGQQEQRARWKRGVDAVNGALGEAVGQVYVQRHFPPEAKLQMNDLVENVRKAYAQRIDTLAWMTPETKVVAREKLAAFRTKIGYPDKWKDYSKLEVRKGDALGNSIRASVFEWQEEVARINKPTDRDEWFMTPQTVNAYYNPTFNEIVFPAAILQPPFFDPNADPAVNYGGIGGVIGHEMGHGFDDQGAKSDPRGVLRNWWNDRDVAAFKKLGDALADQYSQYSPREAPTLKLNGRLGLGENIGDNGGLQVSYTAYQLSLGGKPAPVIDGMTGDQRFFHGWGQVWRALYTPQRMRNQVMTGPHSPPEFRVNGTVRNMDAWYAAFNVQPGDAMYLPPEKRVHIW
jgi:putative endopeptidase